MRQPIGGMAKLKTFAARHRNALFAIALLVFVVGLTLAVRNLDVRPREFAWTPLLVNLLVSTPIAFLLTVWGLQLSARTIGHSIGFRRAIQATAFGTIAELLPLPGGVMARSAALAQAGASPLDIVHVLSMNALLWFGLIALMAGAAMGLARQPAAALVFTAIGLPAVIASLVSFRRRASLALLGTLLVQRLSSLAINVVRMLVGFAILRDALSPEEAMWLAAANSLGSFSSLLPSGLGVGEALAALAALAIAVPAASAFAVAAINRIFFLLVAGVCALPVMASAWHADSRPDKQSRAPDE
jgi:hypothetical protein